MSDLIPRFEKFDKAIMDAVAWLGPDKADVDRVHKEVSRFGRSRTTVHRRLCHFHSLNFLSRRYTYGPCNRLRAFYTVTTAYA